MHAFKMFSIIDALKVDIVCLNSIGHGEQCVSFCLFNGKTVSFISK